MKFEHRITIEASQEVVWPLLADIPRAASLLPGVEQVEMQDDGSYTGSLRIRLGPMGFTFSGTAKAVEDRKNGLWNMEAQAQDKRLGGSVRAVITVAVTGPSPGVTDLNVSADVQFMGKLGQMGQPLIKRKADSMIKEFAEGLKRTVAGSQS